MNAQAVADLRKEAAQDALPRIADFLEKRLGSTDLYALNEDQAVQLVLTIVFEFRQSLDRLTDAPF